MRKDGSLIAMIFAVAFPAALAIVVGAFPVSERGRALAIFFSISGGLTSIGPVAESYLTQWTWRSIFWINVPVALVAIVLTLRTDAGSERRPGPIDTRGAVLITAAMGLSVLGLQQASVWGWDSVATWGCLAAGLVLLALFVRQQLRAHDPLVPIRLFGDRGFSVDNAVLFLLSICFVPLFFFASIYAVRLDRLGLWLGTACAAHGPGPLHPHDRLRHGRVDGPRVPVGPTADAARSGAPAGLGHGATRGRPGPRLHLDGRGAHPGGIGTSRPRPPGRVGAGCSSGAGRPRWKPCA